MRPLAAALLLLAVPARADEELTCKKPAPGSKLSVTLRPGTTLEELATWVSSFTCLNVVYSADLACRAGGVNVLSPTQMTPAEAYVLFVDALEAMGLKVRAKPRTLVVVEASPGKPNPARCEGTAAAPSPPPAASASPLDYGRYIEKVSDTSYKVDRLLVDRMVGDPSLVASLRIVPSVKDGKANGFKLYAIRPSSVAARLGFENGDTVHALNGVELSSLDKALQAYVTSGGKMTVALTRRGRPITLEYVLR